MHILNFEAFLIAITILTLTPGLDTALVIRNSSRSGYVNGCVTSLGICSGLFVHAMFSAIGISAILGTIVPLIMKGQLAEKFNAPGGNIVFLGMFFALIGIIICGVAGYKKEQDLKNVKVEGEEPLTFNMKKGLTLTLIAGVLSAVFGISLDVGSPINAIAEGRCK